MNYEEFLSRCEWLIATYHLTKQEATEVAWYDTDPETWAGSDWEITA
jgi:hypothetical protein